jgi:hypothetical protein
MRVRPRTEAIDPLASSARADLHAAPQRVTNLPRDMTSGSPAAASLHKARLAAELLALPLTSSGLPLQQHLCAWLRHGVQPVHDEHEMHDALRWLHAPFGDVLAAAYGSASRALVPYVLDQLLLALFPALQDAQRQLLAVDIRRHAQDLPLATWVRALALPRDGQGGEIQLRALEYSAHWTALRAALREAPVPGSGLPQLGLATAALGAAAVASTLMPAVAVPALLAGSAGFLGITAHAAVADAAAPQAGEVQSDALRQRADALLQTLLPTWNGTQRDALYAIWAERPNDHSLLAVTRQAMQALQDADGCIASALDGLQATARLPLALPATGGRAAVAEALARLVIGLSPQQSSVAAGTASTDRESLRGTFNADRAPALRPASTGLYELAQHIARADYRASLERQIDQIGADPEDTRTSCQRRRDKAGLRLLHARSLAPGAERRDAIAAARARVDNLRNPAPLIAQARAGDVQQAMVLNRHAALHRPTAAGSSEPHAAPDLPRTARAGALTEPGSLALAPLAETGLFSGSAAIAMPLRAAVAPNPAVSSPFTAPAPVTAEARLRVWLSQMPEVAGDGQESAIAEYLDLQGSTRSGQSSTVRTELAQAWSEQLQAQATTSRARRTLSARAADMLTQLVEDDRQGTPAVARGVGRFGMLLHVDGSREVAVPGAVVITGKGSDTSPRSATGPIVVMLPGIGLLEYAADGLDTLMRDIDAHPVLRAALYGLIPLERLQPAAGGRGEVTLGFTALDADRTGEEVLERVLQGGIDIRRASTQRAQTAQPLAELVTPYLATAGVVGQALAQLAGHGLLQAPVQDPTRALGLATAWSDYLNALVDAPAVAGLQSPQDYVTSDQLQRHIGDRLRAQLDDLDIDAAPADIRVRWQEVRFRPEPLGLPHNPAGARLLPPIQHDLSLAELAIRNIAFIDIPFSTNATAFDAQGEALPALTPKRMRDWIRGLDLDGSYRRHLHAQFDSSQRGSAGALRLQAFRYTFPARIALEEQLAFAHRRLEGPSVLRQVLAHPGSMAVEHRGRVQQVQFGPLSLTTRAVVDNAYPFERTSALPGTLAVRTEDGRVEAYVAGLRPSPFLSADNEAELKALLASEALQDWLKAHLPDATHRHDLEDTSTWSELSLAQERGDALEACYRRWVDQLQREADERVVSDREQLGKDIIAVLSGVYEFAENLLPLRLEALSMTVRTLAPLLARDGASAQARTLAAETALLRLFSYAGPGTALAVAMKRPLLAAGIPRSLRQQAGAPRPGYIQTRQGDYRIPEGGSIRASGMGVLLDPASGQPAGGMARYDSTTLQWRIDPAQHSRSADYAHLASPLDDQRLRHLSSQGNGVYEVDGGQFVRIDGQWFRSEVRSELGGGRYLMAPGGRVRSDLLLARADDAWVVTQRPRGRLRGGGVVAADTTDLAVLKLAVPATRLLDDTAIQRVLSVHGPVGEQVSIALRRDLRDSAQQVMLGRIGAGKASFEEPDFGEAGRMAVLCALAHDPVLGQGRRIELYTGSAATGQRRIVIGNGAEPLLRLELTRTLSKPTTLLPTVKEVIALLNPDAVAAILKLPAGAEPAALEGAVTAHLQQSLKGHRVEAQAALRTLTDDLDVAAAEVTALQLQFGLDRGLAEAVWQRLPRHGDAILLYQRPQHLVDAIADASARVSERSLRQALLDGQVASVDAVMLLQEALATTLPSWKPTGSLHADGSAQLHMASLTDTRNTRVISFRADGVQVSGHAQPYLKWQEAVSAVIGTDAPRDLRKPSGLASAVAGWLRAREVVAPAARIEPHRRALQQAADQPACPTVAGTCPASARRPDRNDLALQLTLRDTAVSLRENAARALADNVDRAREAARGWFTADSSRTVVGHWTKTHPPGVHAGDDEALNTFIKAHWKSRAARPPALSAFLKAFAAREALKTANILVAEVTLQIDGRPLAWNHHAFVSNAQLGGEHGFSDVSGLRRLDVMVPARLRPGHEGIARPGGADFEAPQALLHRVMTDDYPFGRYVVEPRVQLPDSVPRGAPDTKLHWIGSEAELRSLLRTHVNLGGTPPQVGDPVYLSSVRRCTESQFLNEVADAVEAELPGVWQQPGMLDRVTGSVDLFSDRVPCLNNCQLLMRAAAETLARVDIKMGYGDPPAHSGVIRQHKNPPRLFPLP